MSSKSSAYVLTVVAPATAALPRDFAARAAALLPASGAPVWLAPGRAADIPFAPPAHGFNPRRLREELEALFAPDAIDLAVQPAAHRRKMLLVADMDSTLIAQECIDELASALGLGGHVAGITERAMRGEIAFEPALRERVALLRGLTLAQIHEVFVQRITFTPGAFVLAQTMRAHGAITAVVSGGFTLFTSRVAGALGFAAHFANRLCLEDDVLTGFVEEPILGREAKLELLVSLAGANKIALEDTCAVGDGANDLAMIGRAGLGVAFHAKPAVAAAADARIDHGDLTTLLFFQGYREAEFVREVSGS